MRKIATAAVAVLLLASAAASPASAQQYAAGTAARSREAIFAKFLEYRPMFQNYRYMTDDSIYESVPRTSVPFSPGRLKDAYILDGINAVNFVRYLAGVPDDIVPDWTLRDQQQAASLINAVRGVLEHRPERPAGMDVPLYELGYRGTSGSNLAAVSATLYKSVLMYMSDSDPSNIARVGHRRWVLNPRMTKTMFGFVHSDSLGEVTSMYAIDESRPRSAFHYDFINWPAPGDFPLEVFDPEDAWSVTLNPDRYDNTRTGDIRVRLTRLRDGAVWHFDHSDKDLEGKYFNVDTNRVGVPFAVIFRPDGIERFEPEDAFEVTITGLYLKDGRETSLSYTTTFFPLIVQYEPRADEILLDLGETFQIRVDKANDALGDFAPSFYSSDPEVIEVDDSGVIRALGEGFGAIFIDQYFGPMRAIFVTVADLDSAPSAWAAASYRKAKQNGFVPFRADGLYREPIVRYYFALALHQVYKLLSGDRTVNGMEADRPFNDISDWRISALARLGLMGGKSGDTFAPFDHLTREEAAVLLVRLHDKIRVGHDRLDLLLQQQFGDVRRLITGVHGHGFRLAKRGANVI